MHSIAEIVLPAGTDVISGVRQVMESFFREDDDGNYIPDSAGWWDWYVIGGRFSGHKLEARLGDRLKEFHDFLRGNKVTVSSLRFGKPDLMPPEQAPQVDAWWREWFPGNGNKCPLFNHAYDQYGHSGIYPEDVCTVAELPEALTCERLIIASPHWDVANKLGQVEAGLMFCTEFYNGLNFEKTTFDGLVLPALKEMMMEDYHLVHKLRNSPITADSLVVTVDYHN